MELADPQRQLEQAISEHQKDASGCLGALTGAVLVLLIMALAWTGSWLALVVFTVSYLIFARGILFLFRNRGG